MRNIIENIVDALNETRNIGPLVHNISNYVTVNDCANIILACGGSPIMADDISEVEEITSICNALVINIGTLNARTIPSMISAGKKANKLNHPVILDPVGVGASNFRTDTVLKLLNEVKFAVIRGNASEVKTIYAGSGYTKGVDATKEDEITSENLEKNISIAKSLSQNTGAIIAITGKMDIVANGNKAYIINNGHSMMSRITGTGCMLSAMIGAFCGANTQIQLEATTAAVCMMGLAGEFAYKKMIENNGGNSSFKMYLIDFISKIDEIILKEGAKVEIK